ncbi:MAG: N-6 DNA methylase, partial [Candidatus Stahlbacteria bacterium]|nr:N-6 DNA methylase [Candidatus Stahlbacteria bacterium]
NRIFIRTQLSLGKEFVQEESEKDPIYHFYEPFLAKYNPKERERRGVYYTPLPVVSYIVRSLNILLKEKFNKSSGFADKGVTVLDPAAGTLTFLIEAIKLAVNESIDTQGKGSDSGFVKDHILKNFYAFELMMAPYALGHLKMLFVLKELGYDLKDDGVRFYLTNTLEPGVRESTTIPGIGRTLSEEAGKANEVKKATPILVILSNPPYSGISANMTDWIMNLIKDYKYVDGKPLKERKQWLQDDYVKFIRWAQWKIEQLGEGCIGFITNLYTKFAW